MKGIYKIVDIHPRDAYYRDKDLLIGNKILVVSIDEYESTHLDGFVGCDFKFVELHEDIKTFFLVKLKKVKL